MPLPLLFQFSRSRSRPALCCAPNTVVRAYYNFVTNANPRSKHPKMDFEVVQMGDTGADEASLVDPKEAVCSTVCAEAAASEASAAPCDADAASTASSMAVGLPDAEACTKAVKAKRKREGSSKRSLLPLAMEIDDLAVKQGTADACVAPDDGGGGTKTVEGATQQSQEPRRGQQSSFTDELVPSLEMLLEVRNVFWKNAISCSGLLRVRDSMRFALVLILTFATASRLCFRN